MYSWFWSALRFIGIDARVGDLDMSEVNPADVPWSMARFNFTLFGRKLGGD
jgi:hypothetical protein